VNSEPPNEKWKPLWNSVKESSSFHSLVIKSQQNVFGLLVKKIDAVWHPYMLEEGKWKPSPKTLEESIHHIQETLCGHRIPELYNDGEDVIIDVYENIPLMKRGQKGLIILTHVQEALVEEGYPVTNTSFDCKNRNNETNRMWMKNEKVQKLIRLYKGRADDDGLGEVVPDTWLPHWKKIQRLYDKSGSHTLKVLVIPLIQSEENEWIVEETDKSLHDSLIQIKRMFNPYFHKQKRSYKKLQEEEEEEEEQTTIPDDFIQLSFDIIGNWNGSTASTNAAFQTNLKQRRDDLDYFTEMMKTQIPFPANFLTAGDDILVYPVNDWSSTA
jgi:hypothetical protein